MKLLFIADPLYSFKIYKDTTFAMMREAQRRGHTLAVCEVQHVSWQRGGKVTAQVIDIRLTGDTTRWYEVRLHRGAGAVGRPDRLPRSPVRSAPRPARRVGAGRRPRRRPRDRCGRRPAQPGRLRRRSRHDLTGIGLAGA